MGRKSRQKKLKRMANPAQEQQASEKLVHHLEEKGAKVRLNEGPQKFSDIFADFFSPLLEPWKDDADDIKAKVTWAVMVWNKAMAEELPDHEVSRSVEEQFPMFLLMMPDEELVHDYIARKKMHFSQHKFFIVNHEVVANKSNVSISVAVLEL